VDDDELNVINQYPFGSDGKVLFGRKPLDQHVVASIGNRYSVHPNPHTHNMQPHRHTITVTDINGSGSYVDGAMRNILGEAILDIERLVLALCKHKPLTEEAILEIAKRWQVSVEQQIPYPTFYCDDCGEGVPANKACFVGSLPIAVSSAGVGQSATLCMDCFEEVEPHIPKIHSSIIGNGVSK
jgi:hypothetical protein